MASRNTISGNTVLGIAVSEDAVSEEKTFEKCAFHDFFLVDWPSKAYKEGFCFQFYHNFDNVNYFYNTILKTNY